MSDSLITSRDNKLFRQWISLGTSKGIERHRLALVSGRKIVPELLSERGGDGATLILREGNAPHPNPLPAGGARENNHPLPSGRRQGKGVGEVILARDLFEALDEFGTNAPLLVLPAPQIAKHAVDEKPHGLTLAVAAQDPSNLGAILRSALAFEADEVVLLAESAHPFLPRVTRASAGANFRIKLSKGASIKALDAPWIALDMEGEALDGAALPKDCALLLGEEGLGIPQSFAGRRLKIPIGPRAESLNVAVAAGIVLAAYRRTYPL